MREWKFRIYMWGMVAFVFRPDGSQARAILINALGRIQDEHVPELSFEKNFQVKSPLDVPLPQADEIEGGQSSEIHKWKLREVDLHLRPAPHVTLTEKFQMVNGAIPTGTLPPVNADQFGTVSYLVKLDRLFSDKQVSQINPECFQSPTKSKLFIVRMELDHGRFGVTRLANQRFWKFAPKGDANNVLAHRQPCAIEMCCEVTVPDGPLTVVGRSFCGNHEAGIAFHPGSGDMVEVRLQNRPTMGEGFLKVAAGGMDEDFSLYYDLSSRVIPESERILPIDPGVEDAGSDDPLLTVSGKNCIVLAYADHPDA